MKPTITALYAAILGLMMIGLACRVAYLRQRDRVGIGDGGSKPLKRAIRVHANAMENIPIMLILLLICEMLGHGATLLHLCGVAMVLGRGLHAFGLSRTPRASSGRLLGICLSWLVVTALAIAALYSLFTT